MAIDRSPPIPITDGRRTETVALRADDIPPEDDPAAGDPRVLGAGHGQADALLAGSR
ncbi:MAG TPA: hypothetical protein VFG47_21825 [Geminicoccaceae bacterium]|nr:hypothetical protein [Geminicoccaceae bacterium]